MHNQPHELRRAERTRKSVAMLWRKPEEEGELRIGWALEGSDLGCAFAWRGDDPPGVGDVIELCASEDVNNPPMERALVKRVSLVHDDLAIIAVRVFPKAPFPATLESEAVIAEPRTRTRSSSIIAST